MGVTLLIIVTLSNGSNVTNNSSNKGWEYNMLLIIVIAVLQIHVHVLLSTLYYSTSKKTFQC